jgi:hypothetical protein
MRKPRWKAFEMDDMHTVAARTRQQAIEWFCNECGIDGDEVNPYQVNLKRQYMNYEIAEIPGKHKRKATCEYEGQPCVEITLKKALKYQLRLHKYNEPFILCVCP